MKNRFRRVQGENGERSRFRVFLIHGHSADWEKVKKFIQGSLRFETIVSMETVTGKPIIQKIQEAVWHDCDCAVAILSADDRQMDNKRFARPNVLFEVGYCMGFFDHRYWLDDEIHPVILMMDDRLSLPSDLEGIERIQYSRKKKGGITVEFSKLAQRLETLYSQIDDYFS
jgi:predicted nucleotide-binding protein